MIFLSFKHPFLSFTHYIKLAKINNMADANQINHDQSQQKLILIIGVLIVVIALLVLALTQKEGPADADVSLEGKPEPMEQPVPTTYAKKLPDENEKININLDQQSQGQSDPNQQVMGQNTSQNPNQPISSQNQPGNPGTTNQMQDITMNKTNLPKPEMIIDQNKDYTASMETNKGTIKFKLFADQTPITVNNFVYLANAGFYNNLTFHRIIKDFMIQGGCPLGTGTGNPGYQFQDEPSPTKLVKGSLAMANSGPNTNGSQFFIVTADTASWLDGKHTNFGEVIEGMDVVEKIEQVETGPNDLPNQPVIIKSVTINES